MEALTRVTDDPRLTRIIDHAPRPYQKPMRELLEALAQSGFTIETLTAFVGNPKEIGASRYNTRLKAARRLVRDMADYLPLTAAQRWELDRALSQKKLIAGAGAATPDRVPTPSEVQLLIAHADTRLSLMIRFLWETGLV